MKQFITKVKVGDLLHTIWSTDTIVFEERIVEDISGLSEDGISGEIFLQTLNNHSIQATINNLSCKIHDISDISGESFIRDVMIKNYEWVFSLPMKNKKWDECYIWYEDVYDIDSGDFSIDLSIFITNAIRSQEPIVKIKNDESLSDWWIEIVDIPDL